MNELKLVVGLLGFLVCCVSAVCGIASGYRPVGDYDYPLIGFLIGMLLMIFGFMDYILIGLGGSLI